MKLYVLVEGAKTEKIVHKGWLSFCFPGLVFVNAPEHAARHPAAAFMISGNGYPAYKDRIRRSLEDLRVHPDFEWFVVLVDSEELSASEKRDELDEIVAEGGGFQGTRLVVQCRCIETWLLANVRHVRASPQSPKLQQFQRFYDVRVHDPELLPRHPDYRNVADTHFEYLRATFAERKTSYTKNRPWDAAAGPYFLQLWRRHAQTGHIPSFGALTALYREMSARYPEQLAAQVCFPEPEGITTA